MGMSGSAHNDHGSAGALLVARGLGAWTCATAVIAVVVLMLVTLAGRASSTIWRAPIPGSGSGLADLLLWSTIVVSIALPPSALIAFFAAVAAAERPVGGWAGAAVNASLRFAPAIPSVVFGVAALAIVTSDAAVFAWAHENAMTAAVIALGALNLPIMTARFRTAFREVPHRWRMAAAAAGADPPATFFGIVVPRAALGTIAAMLTAAGQMLGETALLAIVLGVGNGGLMFALAPLSVHLWEDLLESRHGLTPAVSQASEVLVLLAAIVVLRFAARVLLRRRRRSGATA
jgi:ABC-type phosphate transport system permease subunit